MWIRVHYAKDGSLALVNTEILAEVRAFDPNLDGGWSGDDAPRTTLVGRRDETWFVVEPVRDIAVDMGIVDGADE